MHPAPTRLAAALACACALAGCTLGPDYKRPEVPLPPAWRAAPPADAADVVNTAWWEAFGDPELSAMVQIALDENKDLQLAVLRVEQFDARLQVSRSAQYPELGYGVAAERQRRSEERPILLPAGQAPTQNAFQVGLNASWELDVWGKVQRSNESALADLLATEQARRAVMLSVVTSVASSYVELLGLDESLSIARQTLKNRQDAQSLSEQRYQGGSGTRLAAVKARAAAEEAAAPIPEIERQIASIENALSGLLGRNPDAVKRRTIDALKLPAVPQGVPSDVLTRRPDVLAAEQALIAANARIGVAKSQYFPTVSLTAALGLASDQLRWLTARDARTGELGLGIVGTIFSAGRIEGNVREAEAVQKQTVVQYQQAIQTALREVEDALVARAKAGDRLAIEGKRVDSLGEVAQLSRQRYEGGQSTLIDVLEAEREVYKARNEQAQTRRDAYVALISLYKAMGGGWMVEQARLHPMATLAGDAAHLATTEQPKASE